MEDLFHRKIDYLRISVTDRCNFRCIYCMPGSRFVPMDHSEVLTYEEIEYLCRLFARQGIRNIKLTGGEPLVRKGIVSLVEKIHTIPEIQKITMTTNGSLLGRYVSDLKAAGLYGVNISLDTLKPEVFAKITGRDQLKEVIDAIFRSLEVGIPSVKINCVPVRGVNDNEIIELASLAKENPIEVRFIEKMPIGTDKGCNEITEDEIRHMLETSYGSLQFIDKKLGNGPAVYYQPEGFVGHIGFISAMSHKFCSNCNRIRLTSDGILKPCLQYAGRMNLKQMIREGVSEKELTDMIGQVIREKPECHQFQEQIIHDDEFEINHKSYSTNVIDQIEERPMTSIGG